LAEGHVADYKRLGVKGRQGDWLGPWFGPSQIPRVNQPTRPV